MMENRVGALTFVFVTALSCAQQGYAADIKVELFDDRKMIKIAIVGSIESGDEIKFRNKVLRWTADDKGYWIRLVKTYSKGGNVDAAMNIGRQIRLLKTFTEAPYFRKDGTLECFVNKKSFGFNPKTGSGTSTCTCVSACSLVWIAGYGRRGHVVGVHRPSFPRYVGELEDGEAHDLYEKTLDQWKLYLSEMGIPDFIAQVIFSVRSNKNYFLTKDHIQLVMGPLPHMQEKMLEQCDFPPNDKDLEADDENDCVMKIYEQSSREGILSYRLQNSAPRESRSRDSSVQIGWAD